MINNNLSPDKILMYFRKSRQDNPNQTVEEVLMQHRRIADEWISNNLPAPIPEENIYMERVSGETIRDRTEFQKVLRRIEDPDIEAVWVVEPQRLSRGDLEDCGHIINVFRYTHTKIIIPHRVYDLDDDGDRIIMEMELKSGNQYLEYTKRILKRGKEDAIKQGYWLASTPPYGYKIVKIGKRSTLEIIPEEAEVVRKVFQLYLEGMGTRTICRYLNDNGIKPMKSDLFRYATIKQMLHNPSYIGMVRWNSHMTTTVIENGVQVKKRIKQKEPCIYKGLHEPIIDKETFDKVQESFSTHSHVRSDYEPKNLLRGIMRCGKCGRIMYRTSSKTNGMRYVCSDATNCINGSAEERYILNDVRKAIEQEIKNTEFLIKNDNTRDVHQEWENEKARIQSKIEKLNDKETKMWNDRYESDSQMPDAVFRKLSEQLNAERDNLRKALEKLQTEEPQQIDYKEIIVTLKEALDCMNGDYSVEQKNKMLRNCIETIHFQRDQVTNVHDSYTRVPYKLDFVFKF